MLFVGAPDVRADEANQMVGVWKDDETGSTYTIPDVRGAFKIIITWKGGQTQTVDADWEGKRGRVIIFTTERGVKWRGQYNPAKPDTINLTNTESKKVHNLKRVAKL